MITTLLQHRLYPDDADVYVPYSAPFFNTDRDTTMQRYWYTNGHRLCLYVRKTYVQPRPHPARRSLSGDKTYTPLPGNALAGDSV
ncbi:MAG: hypothetical protein IJR42_04875 [Paludibacteraceae bacterium]|nr:hypothetical protein [Paludibacteraceae bacterium]